MDCAGTSLLHALQLFFHAARQLIFLLIVCPCPALVSIADRKCTAMGLQFCTCADVAGLGFSKCCKNVDLCRVVCRWRAWSLTSNWRATSSRTLMSGSASMQLTSLSPWTCLSLCSPPASGPPTRFALYHMSAHTMRLCALTLFHTGVSKVCTHGAAVLCTSGSHLAPLRYHTHQASNIFLAA